MIHPKINKTTTHVGNSKFNSKQYKPNAFSSEGLKFKGTKKLHPNIKWDM